MNSRNQSKVNVEFWSQKAFICHSFWKGGDEIFNGLFVNYHNEESLKSAFQADFDIITIETNQEFDERDSLVLIAKKKDNGEWNHG